MGCNANKKDCSNSISTCESKSAKKHSKNCTIETCKMLRESTTLHSEICKKLLEKKKLFKNACTKQKKNLIQEFEIMDKEETKKNQFVFNKDYITLDSFGFGMGHSCIQMTYSSRNMSEARKMYDFLSVLSGLLTPFSASTAVVDSALIDWDVRSRLIEQSTDSRSRREYVSFFSTIL